MLSFDYCRSVATMCQYVLFKFYNIFMKVYQIPVPKLCKSIRNLSFIIYITSLKKIKSVQVNVNYRLISILLFVFLY